MNDYYPPNQNPNPNNYGQQQFYNGQQPPVQPQMPPYGAPPMYPGPNPYGPPVVPGKGMGIASMVLGIIAIVFMCMWYIGIPCAVVGLALGGVSYSKAKAARLSNGMATAGIVMCVIAVGIDILGATLLASFVSSIVPW